MNYTIEIFSLLDEANGFNNMTDEQKKAVLLKINEKWDKLPEEKLKCNEKSMLALFMHKPLLSLSLFDLAEKWINILLIDRINDPSQVGMYKGKLAFEKQDFKTAYEYFQMAYQDSKDRPFQGEKSSYLDLVKNPEKYPK